MKYIFVIIFILINSDLLFSQAWTKPKGNGFYKLDYTLIITDKVFDPHGEIVPFRTLGNHAASFYGERGITDKLTIQAYFPFFVRNVLNPIIENQTGKIVEPGAERNSIGDLDLAFRYALKTNGVAVSTLLLLGFPTGDSNNENGLLTGDGEFNQMIKLNAGTGSKKWWTQIGVGFNNRTTGFSDEFRYDAEFGFKFLDDKLLAIFKLAGIESFNNGTEEPTITGLFSNNVEYLSPGLEFLYYLNPKLGVSFRAAGAVKGQNVLAAPSFSFGIFGQF